MNLFKKNVVGFLLIILLLPIMDIKEVYSAPTERENFHHGDVYDARYSYGGNSWLTQTFLTTSGVSNTHTVTSAKIFAGHDSDTGDFTTYVEIFATDGSGKPTGSALSTGSVAKSQYGSSSMHWLEFILSPEITLSTNTTYAVVSRATLTGSCNPYWGRDNHNGYADGKHYSSNNAGSTWTEQVGYDALFQIWGNDATAEITVTSTYTGTGYIKVDNVSQTTPYIYTYIIGQTVLIEALSPRTIITNVERKVYNSWSDSGTQTHNITVVFGGGTYTANYHTEYRHIISSYPISGDNILSIDDSDETSPYTTGWLDSGSTISLNCTLFSSSNIGFAFDYWSDSLSRHHHVIPTTSLNYTAYYSETPYYWNSTINIIGNATVTVNTIPHVLPYSFNASLGTEYNITAISDYVISGNITLNVDGNATITLDGVPVITPDTFILISGSEYDLIANGGAGSGSNIIYAPIVLLSLSSLVVFSLVISLRKKRRW